MSSVVRLESASRIGAKPITTSGDVRRTIKTWFVVTSINGATRTMSKNDKHSKGAPYRNRYRSTFPGHQKVRYNGFSLEAFGRHPVGDMEKAADIAVSSLRRIKRSELAAELSNSVSKRLFNLVLDDLFGEDGEQTGRQGELKQLEPTKVASGMSYDEMQTRPMECEDGVIADGYIMKGQLTFCVGGADSGKTFIAIDTAIAAASGAVPTYLPPTSRPSERMNVIIYRLENRAGEMPKRYGTGSVFQGLPIKWIMRTDLPSPTQEGLISDIKGQCERITTDTLIIVDPLSKLNGWSFRQYIYEMEAIQLECAEKGIVLSVFTTGHTEEDKPWNALTSDRIVGGDDMIRDGSSVFSLRHERSGKAYRFLQVLKPPKGGVDKETVSVVRFEGIDENDPDSYTHLVYDCEKTIQNALPKKPKPEDDDIAIETGKKNGRGKLAGRDEEIVQRYLHGDTVKDMSADYDVSAQAIYDILEKNGIQRKR